jgi:GTP-binding protein Era
VSERAHRSGVVALLGRPNAGKSTLLNRILGEKIAIVTAKPQTTRSRILGIWNGDGVQVLFLDTPGFHESQKPLNLALHEVVESVVDDCDVGVLLIDPARGADAGHVALSERFRRAGKPLLLVATQCDRPDRAGAPWPPKEMPELTSFRTSGETGEGVDSLLDSVVELLPEGPSFYGADELTDRPLRFLVAELVREAAFEALEQELPYSLAVAVQSFDESDPAMVRIRANLLVERKSQKGIVLGRGGSMIKRIGTQARHNIERLLDTRVHLDLWVKIDPHWAKQPRKLRDLGYH